MSQTLYPKLLRMLHMEPAQHPRSQPHVSSASGLVLLHSQGRNHCYAVADDEHHLGHFVLDDGEAVELLRIFPGDLPDDAKQRKNAKPDLECLCALPAMPGYPQGALLALGSGSKEQRHTGLLIPLNAQGLLSPDVDSRARRFDLTELYALLHDEFDDLNIEGCFMQGSHLCLLQRGNKGASGSACIRFDAAHFQSWLFGEQAPSPERIFKIDLGQVNGIPLTPTDGIARPDGRCLVSAAAENTDDSFTDGPCAGSALAVLNSEGRVLELRLLQGAPKVEGIALWSQTGAQQVLMVTDADDPALASQLLSVNSFWN